MLPLKVARKNITRFQKAVDFHTNLDCVSLRKVETLRPARAPTADTDYPGCRRYKHQRMEA